MTDWNQVKQIFNSALERDVHKRGAFLTEACGGDAEMRRQVEELLADYQTDFLENVSDTDLDRDRMNSGGRLKAGDTISHYEIGRLIGVGGMGEVYLARDTLLDRWVAIKLLNDKYESDQSNIARFIQEAKAASSLNHPNILTIHEIGRTGDTHYIVSEYIDGKTLREVLDTEGQKLSKILDIAIQVASALAAAHSARIIHRDIKPENIIVRNDGYAKVLDFGLAKLLAEQPSFAGFEAETVKQNLTAQGLIVGTVNYMSPEQARGEAVDHRTDIFSLGVVIYEMISGRKPFDAKSQAEVIAAILVRDPVRLADIAPAVTSDLQDLIMKMLAKDAGARIASMQTVAESLKRCRDGLSSQSDQLTERISVATTLKTQRSWLRVFSKRKTSALAAMILLVAVSGAWIYFRTSGSSQNNTRVVSRSPAYDLYLRGKVRAGSDNREEIEDAIRVLEQAVAIDPNFAEAYASLAQAYTTKAFQFAPDSEKKQISENAEVAVEKALSLNPDLAEGHFARAVVLWTHTKRFPHEQTIQAHKRAIALNPNLDEAHHRLGMVYSHIGLLDEAAREIKTAIDINPNNTMARFRIGVVYAYQGNYEQAMAVFKTVPHEVSPALIDRNVADTLVHLGKLREAEELADDYLKKYPQDEGGNVTSVKAVLFAKAGKRDEAERMIARAIDVGTGYGHFHHTAYNIASAYAIMERPDEALKWLQNAADDGFPNYSYFEIDHNLDNLRNYRPFIQFMSDLKAQTERFRSLANAN